MAGMCCGKKRQIQHGWNALWSKDGFSLLECVGIKNVRFSMLVCVMVKMKYSTGPGNVS
jgi:hypothetical protein